ncbi:MAG: MBL fold metallo-hydrolase [Spirochaetes bacterium]|nr:MBL fold metallo-hydrolase [Spirochaetota bacterium]
MTVFFHYSLYGFSNVYLVANDDTGEAIIVDPAEFTVNLLNFIEKRDYYIKNVLVTHNHMHHIKGLKTLLKIYQATVYSSNMLPDRSAHTAIHDGDEFRACNLPIEVISVPGHSPDSVVYKIGKLLFTGDTIQAGLLGSTNSQYGNSLLRDQLTRKIFNQSDDCIILPGHGPPTTVGAEKKFNAGMKQDHAAEKRGRYFMFL